MIGSMRNCSSVMAWLMALVMLAIASPRALAQQGKAELSATVSPAALKPGDRATVSVIVDIADGYHSQSHTPSGENYIALVVKPESTDAVKAGEPVYPAGVDVS